MYSSDTAENKGRDRLLMTPGHTGGDVKTKVADGQRSSDTGDTLIQTQDSDPESGIDSQDAARTPPSHPFFPSSSSHPMPIQSLNIYFLLLGASFKISP